MVLHRPIECTALTGDWPSVGKDLRLRAAEMRDEYQSRTILSPDVGSASTQEPATVEVDFKSPII